MKLENIKLLPNKIAKYSLMAGAALSLLNSCKKDDDNDNPNVEVTDVNPDISLTVPINDNLFQHFDLNGDGINDVSLVLINDTYTYYGYNFAKNTSFLSCANGAKVLGQVQTLSFNGYTYNYDVVTPLNAGNPISATQTAWLDVANLGSTGNIFGDAGLFLGLDKYVGVRFQAAGNTHYAWIQLSLSTNGANVVVKKHAYHVTPNTTINAGEE